MNHADNCLSGYVTVVSRLGLKRRAGFLVVARFAYEAFRASLLFAVRQFAKPAIRLVATSAMKTTAHDRAAAETSRILRVVASVPP